MVAIGEKVQKLLLKKPTRHLPVFLCEHQNFIEDLHSAALLLLKGLQIAHEEILKDAKNPEEVYTLGTTTLCGGLLLNMSQDETDPFLSKWGFICVSVGDCKAYLYPCQDKASLDENGTKFKIRDITKDNRRPGTIDVRDCGGRLGPTLKQGAPDLNNLTIQFQACQPGDFIIILTDGVHDNLDPQYMGIEPRMVGLEGDSWVAIENANPELSYEKRDNYRKEFIAKTLKGLNSPQQVTEMLLSHCRELTKKSREFMQNNGGKKVPEDYKLFPGKMDHTTCVCLRV